LIVSYRKSAPRTSIAPPASPAFGGIEVIDGEYRPARGAYVI
jgi:hypothetical protein